jgi:hypothetical protein
MAITSNSSETQVSGGGGVKLYVGIAAVNVVAVNPSLSELNAIGVNLKNEPEYKNVEIGGEVYNKIVFWVKNYNPEFATKVEFLVQPQPRVSQSGKAQWVNNIGQFAFSDAKASEAYEWFKDEGVRKAFVGEEKLMSFIKAFANVANGDDCYFEGFQKISNGDVTELRALVNQLGDNKVRVLLGVKDEKYQQVYDKHFGRIKPKRDDLFIKSLNDDYGAFKAEYNKSLLLEEYSVSLIAPDEDQAPDASPFKDDMDSDWG